MDNSSNKKQLVERILQTEYGKKGFLLEDDIIDTWKIRWKQIWASNIILLNCINQTNYSVLKSLFKIAETEKNINDTESYVDRSHLDYDALLGKIKYEYPNCTAIIDEILDILPPQSKILFIQFFIILCLRTVELSECFIHSFIY